jgi:SAM-dependent methyltransferase
MSLKKMYNQNYIKWKSWDEGINNTKTTLAYYKKICKLSSLDERSTVLEVGFGNASFIEFGSKKFNKIIGVEANIFLVEKFKYKYEVYGIDYINSTSQRFDSIVLFDVLEHIERDELVEFIKMLVNVLKPGGSIIARFPNGDSPLSCLNYNSDLTHRTWIGSGVISYISKILNLELVYAGGDPMPIVGAKFLTQLHRVCTICILKFIDLVFNVIYLRSNQYSVTAINALVIYRKK